MTSTSEVGSQQIPFVSLVLKLLDCAAEMVDDRPAAKHCIAQAVALLRNDKANLSSCGSVPTLARGGLAAWQVRRVTEHIDAALSLNIRVGDCASIARLSRSHFRRAFKVSFGMAFSDYLSHRRIERSQEMLMMTDEPLCYVARCCGFADQSHFSRVFRRFVGSSPGVWRRVHDGHSLSDLASGSPPALGAILGEHPHDMGVARYRR
jgi:AraC-like DNA-binding protein